MPGKKQTPNGEVDRLLPTAIDVERLVLGSALQHKEPLEWAIELDPQAFSLESHRRIQACMVDMAARGDAVDLITLANELKIRGHLQAIGGLTYLSSLTEGLPEIQNLPTYIKILREKMHFRRIIIASQEAINRAFSESSLPEEISTTLSESVQAAGLEEGDDDGGLTPVQVIENFPGGLTAFLDPTRRQIGLPTGFTRFDEMTTGMHGGELIVIAARPGHGKSALVSNIATNLALNPKLRKHVALFSLEMTAENLVTRMACSHGFVNAHRFRTGALEPEERTKLQRSVFELTECQNLRIYDRGISTAKEIIRKIRRLVLEEGLHLAIIDYLQLIGGHANSDSNRNQEVSLITRNLKLLSQELSIPIVLLSQLSRKTEQRGGAMRPMLSDLRDSGGIEQDADIVAFIFREELYKRARDRGDAKGKAELILQKQRNGPVGTIHLRFLSQFVRFLNPKEGDPEDPESDND